MATTLPAFAHHRAEPEPIDLPGRQLIGQVSDQAIFMVDRQGRMASWNAGVGAILSWAEADWLGQPMAVAFTPEDVAAGVPQAELRQALETGSANDDRWMRRRDGERFFALGTVTRLQTSDGNVIGFLKVLRDFTEQKAVQETCERLMSSALVAQQRAEEESASLVAAVEAIGDAVVISMADGAVRCNRAALDWFGLDSADELQHIGVQALLQRLPLRRHRGAEALALQEWPLTHALAGERSISELWARKAGALAEAPLRCAAAPIVVEGRTVGAVLVYSDLSHRLQLDRAGAALSHAESALYERDAELRAMVGGVRDYAIFTINVQGRISSWHEGAELMKGYTAAEAIGMNYAELFTPEDRASGSPAMELDVAERTGEFTCEGRRMRKDGSAFDAAVVLTALRGPRGELLGYLKLTQDITQRRRQEREREDMLCAARAAQAEAQRANSSKDEFLATISHELRTPLSAILGWSGVLERGQPDAATQQQGLQAISRNARIQVQLIEDLLDMSRIESGQLRLELQPVELVGLLVAAVDSARPAATQRGLTIGCVFGAGIGTVEGDPSRLQQVVGNLLSNAIKFTPTGGRIVVACTQRQGMAELSVADTGQGMSADFLPRIFNRFQQQDATPTRRHGGLGIGLAVVRHLVQLHGGQVEARSAGPGLGSTFVVRLPALPPASAAADALPATPTGQPVTRLDGVRVLLVDDEEDVRSVTARVLQDAGAHVICADSAAQALAALAAQPDDLPHALLSDIGMPGVDGYQLLQQIRALPAARGGHIPAAAFTAFARPDDRQRTREAGFSLHLVKPLKAQVLVRAVAGLVGLT